MSDPTDIPYWRRLDSRITTSGQPSEAQLFAIRDLGVGLIINLNPSEAISWRASVALASISGPRWVRMMRRAPIRASLASSAA